MAQVKDNWTLIGDVQKRIEELASNRRERNEEMKGAFERFRMYPTLGNMTSANLAMNRYAEAHEHLQATIKKKDDMTQATQNGFYVAEYVDHKGEVGRILSLDGDRNGPLIEVKFEGLNSPQWYHPRELTFAKQEVAQ